MEENKRMQAVREIRKQQKVGSKAYSAQLFPTPSGLAQRMLNLIALKIDPTFSVSECKRILEPSAGTGQLILTLLDNGAQNIDYYELIEEHEQLMLQVVKPYLEDDNPPLLIRRGRDFVEGFNGKIYRQGGWYDLVFANPPFNNGWKHLRKMVSVCRPGGIVCTLLGDATYRTFKADKSSAASKAKTLGLDSIYISGEEPADKKDRSTWHFPHTNAGYSILIGRKHKYGQEFLF